MSVVILFSHHDFLTNQNTIKLLSFLEKKKNLNVKDIKPQRDRDKSMGSGPRDPVSSPVLPLIHCMIFHKLFNFFEAQLPYLLNEKLIIPALQRGFWGSLRMSESPHLVGSAAAFPLPAPSPSFWKCLVWAAHITQVLSFCYGLF